MPVYFDDLKPKALYLRNSGTKVVMLPVMRFSVDQLAFIEGLREKDVGRGPTHLFENSCPVIWHLFQYMMRIGKVNNIWPEKSVLGITVPQEYIALSIEFAD